MATGEGQAGAGTPEGVNQGGATLDAAVAAELELLEQGDEGDEGSQQRDNRKRPTDDSTDSNEQDDGDDDGDDEGDSDGTDQDDDGDDEGETDGALVEHEHEGKTYKIPKELVPALMKDADYRQKTEGVARYVEQLRAQEQQVAQLFEVGQETIQARATLGALNQRWHALQQELAADPGMEHSDPVRYGAIGTTMQRLAAATHNVNGNIARGEQQLTAYQEQQRAERIAVAAPVLERLGVTRDVQQKCGQFAAQYGLTQEELAYVDSGNNPALVLMINDARQWRELQAQKGKVTKQVREAQPMRPVAKPGSVSQGNNRGSRESLGKRLASTGSYSDAVALELAHMARPPGRRQR